MLIMEIYAIVLGMEFVKTLNKVFKKRVALSVSNCIFTNNEALQGASIFGYIYVDLVVSNCQFTENKATAGTYHVSGGAGIYLSLESTLTVTQSSFTLVNFHRLLLLLCCFFCAVFFFCFCFDSALWFWWLLFCRLVFFQHYHSNVTYKRAVNHKIETTERLIVVQQFIWIMELMLL